MHYKKTDLYPPAIFKVDIFLPTDISEPSLKVLTFAELCRLLQVSSFRIEKKHEILEIGCGWGSLAMEVVKRTGCKYTGITLSKEQLKFAEERVKDWPSGLSYFKHGSVSKYSWPESTSAMSRFCVCCFVIETPIYNSHVCTNSSKDQPNTTFQTNLNILFSSLSSNATKGNHFYQTTVTSETPNAIKGLFLCRGDTLTTTCHDCVTAASTDLKRRCSVNKEAIICTELITGPVQSRRSRRCRFEVVLAFVVPIVAVLVFLGFGMCSVMRKQAKSFMWRKTDFDEI
ncbi:Cyclopropane-fatty-acyl-phospholipid synthase [Trifolium repens]|nr:Cyclopropane-fatty-acyl-phospholipid synthase [Trifolium repens]